ncbi:MAG: prenyltransferase, partial [Candidatus Gastranaerophilales bacterium]|nr:prenyltransferase [Candidatus Gastranaerophilales bacterium]
ITLKQAYIISFLMFFAAFVIGVYFINIWGMKLFYIIILAALICLVYPVLGSLGFGEILVSIIFSPLLYSGVYYVMKGQFSFDILVLSFSTGLLSVAILHNHMLLDYKYDKTNRKITLCRLCGSERNALILLEIFITAAYINLIIWFCMGKLHYIYLFPLITIPRAAALINVMKIHINNPDKEIKYNILTVSFNRVNKLPKEQRNFISKFLTAQNLLSSFTLILCISIVIYNYIVNN